MATPSNLLIIMADDLGAWGLGCTGTPEVSTPVLDGLAAGGLRFDSFFCASPVCSPARASWLTGRCPSAHGVHDWLRLGNIHAGPGETWSGPDRPIEYLAGQAGFTDLLADAGWTVGMCGKWHMGDSATPQKGHSWWVTHSLGGDNYYRWSGFDNSPQRINHDEYVTDYFADRAISFLGQHGGGEQPWCLNLHFTAPHTPWGRAHHPAELWDKYHEMAIASAPDEPRHPWYTGEFEGPPVKARWAGYLAAIEAMDTAIGRVLARLDEMNLREETLVVFVGDNGMCLGHHGIWGKGNGTFPQNMYDTSVKIPCIMNCPGAVPAGVVAEGLYSQLDWLPTVADLYGLPLPDSPLPGRSFAGLLRGEADAGAGEVVIADEYGPVRMIRTTDWKYVHRYPDGPHELYDLAADPGERTNLVDTAAHAPRVAEMRAQLAAWWQRWGLPSYDGASLPVDGVGQNDWASKGVEAFQQRRR